MVISDDDISLGNLDKRRAWRPTGRATHGREDEPKQKTPEACENRRYIMTLQYQNLRQTQPSPFSHHHFSS